MKSKRKYIFLDRDKDELSELFRKGKTIEQLAEYFTCTKKLIKKNLGSELKNVPAPNINLQKLAKLVDKSGVIELRMRMQEADVNPMLTFQFSIIQRDIEIMKWLSSNYGGHFFLNHSNSEFHYVWYLNRKHGIKLLREVYPFLKEKKSQTKIYLDCANTPEKYIIGITGKEVAPTEWAQKMAMWEQIIKLNLPKRNNKLQKDFTAFIAQIKKFFIQPQSEEDLSIGRFDPKIFDEKEWERLITQLYWDEELNSTEIAHLLGCGQTTIRRPMGKLGILKI